MRISRAFPIVLGSASPRRRELLTLASVPFVVHAAAADESALPAEAPFSYLERITLAKLAAVRSALRSSPVYAEAGENDRAILVADTIVVAPDGSLFGKPGNEGEGRRMLERLGGATHTVGTRFLIAPLGSKGNSYSETVTTAVTFRSLFEGEAAAYVASGEGDDKAGGYAVQGGGAAFVERIDGSYANVVGLPLCQVVVALRGMGWQKT